MFSLTKRKGHCPNEQQQQPQKWWCIRIVTFISLFSSRVIICIWKEKNVQEIALDTQRRPSHFDQSTPKYATTIYIFFPSHTRSSVNRSDIFLLNVYRNSYYSMSNSRKNGKQISFNFSINLLNWMIATNYVVGYFFFTLT